MRWAATGPISPWPGSTPTGRSTPPSTSTARSSPISVAPRSNRSGGSPSSPTARSSRPGTTSTFKTAVTTSRWPATTRTAPWTPASTARDGKVSTDFAAKGGKTPASDEANGLVIQPDGKIVLVGSTRSGDRHQRLRPGPVQHERHAGHLLRHGREGGHRLRRRPGGGHERGPPGRQRPDPDRRRGVRRALRANGFRGGSVQHQRAPGHLLRRRRQGHHRLLPAAGNIAAIAIQADGKIVAVGNAYDGTRFKLALARYLGRRRRPARDPGRGPDSRRDVPPSLSSAWLRGVRLRRGQASRGHRLRGVRPIFYYYEAPVHVQRET